MRAKVAVVGAVLVVLAGLTACSSDGETSTEGPDAIRGATEEEVVVVRDRPDGAAAEFGEPLEGGDGIWLATLGGGPSLEDAGYTEAEYAASGTATSYSSATPLPADGSFELEPGEDADYATRVVVRRPADASAFNGTVVVEWLNVSSGADATPDYTYMADELLRGGYVWVGVSAQHIGIEGGPIAVAVPGTEGFGLGDGLRAMDPERYGDLRHPGDAFAYDIYSQVGRALLTPGDVDPLEGLSVERLLAVGESQSAFALTTYVNGVQPLTELFDGFLIHSRFGAASPLGEPDAGIDLVTSLGGPPTTIRTDGDAPVIVVQAEGDVVSLLNYFPARQPDSDRFRLWEVAGAAHSDVFQVGANESALGCAELVNRGQQVFVVRAALRHLDTWVKDGTAPAEAARLEVDETGVAPTYVLDDVGNVVGGVRSPVVDAPVDALSGMAPPGSSIVCLLMGSTIALSPEQLADLYATPDEYLAAYEAATDAMIEAGFALPEDREQILDGADPSRLAG